MQNFDIVDFVIGFESGALDEAEVIEGFQHLIESGVVWSLQGFYGRTAAALIEAGHCTRPAVPKWVRAVDAGVWNES
jgi:hypothetical protein